MFKEMFKKISTLKFLPKQNKVIIIMYSLIVKQFEHNVIIVKIYFLFKTYIILIS